MLPTRQIGKVQKLKYRVLQQTNMYSIWTSFYRKINANLVLRRCRVWPRINFFWSLALTVSPVFRLVIFRNIKLFWTVMLLDFKLFLNSESHRLILTFRMKMRTMSCPNLNQTKKTPKKKNYSLPSTIIPSITLLVNMGTIYYIYV